MERHFLKGMNAQQLQSSVQGAGQRQLLVEDGHHQVNGHGNPNLGLHGVGACSVVVFDAQVAFDPAEEQFDPPAQTVDFGHGQCGDGEMVGQKDKVPPSVGVEVAHLAQERGKGRSCFDECGFANLVAAQTSRVIHRQRTLPGKALVVLGACDEEGPGRGNPMQPLEIQVAAIHHIEGSRFEKQFVEPEHIVLARAGDVNAGGNPKGLGSRTRSR